MSQRAKIAFLFFFGLVLITGCGETLTFDVSSQGGQPVDYYQQQALNEVSDVCRQVPVSQSNRNEVVRLLSRFENLQEKKSNIHPDMFYTEEEINLISDTLNDYPHLVLRISNIAHEFEQRMIAIGKATPIDVNGTTVIPDDNGYYDLPTGPIHAAEYLQCLQNSSPKTKQIPQTRGYAYVMRSLLGALFDRGMPWPQKKIHFFMGSYKQDKSARRNRIVANMAALSRGTGVHLNMWSRGSWFCRRTRYIVRTSLWALGVLGAVRVIIRTESAPGTATIGRMFWPRVRYNTAVVDNDGDDNEMTIQHELCHVLGMLHEHQRSDRDKYIRFTRGGDDRNTMKLDGWTLLEVLFPGFKVKYSPYDYNSIMHYRKNTVANPFEFIIPGHQDRADEWRGSNKQQYGYMNGGSWLSGWDIYSLRCMYGLSPNPKPTYTPGEDLARSVVYSLNGGAGSVPVDNRIYSAGMLVTTPPTGGINRVGYVFVGWVPDLDGQPTLVQPGTTFSMPDRRCTVRAQWRSTTQVLKTVYYRNAVASPANWFMLCSIDGFRINTFPGFSMSLSGDWRVWTGTVPAGDCTVEFISSSGRRDNGGGSGYLVLSNTAWIENGVVQYSRP